MNSRKSKKQKALEKDLAGRMIKVMQYALVNSGNIETYADFAKAIGAHPTRISAWSKGKHHPTAWNMHNAHVKFGIDINWLLTGKGKMISDKEDQLTKIERMIKQLSKK